jgi:DNA gyrase subunit A
MMKLVDSSEFEVTKKTVMATKLNKDDKLVSIVITDSLSDISGTHETLKNIELDTNALNAYALSGGSDDIAGDYADMGMMSDMDNEFEQMSFIDSYQPNFGNEEAVITNEMVVLQTDAGVFLRFALREIPEKKKGAVGVRGIKLSEGDYITHVYVLDAGDNITIEFKGKEVSLRKLKTAKRDTKGTKIRL